MACEQVGPEIWAAASKASASNGRAANSKRTSMARGSREAARARSAGDRKAAAARARARGRGASSRAWIETGEPGAARLSAGAGKSSPTAGRAPPGAPGGTRPAKPAPSSNRASAVASDAVAAASKAWIPQGRQRPGPAVAAAAAAAPGCSAGHRRGEGRGDPLGADRPAALRSAQQPGERSRALPLALGQAANSKAAVPGSASKAAATGVAGGAAPGETAAGRPSIIAISAKGRWRSRKAAARRAAGAVIAVSPWVVASRTICAACSRTLN